MGPDSKDQLQIDNRRASRRQRVMLGGLIVSRGGAQTWDCAVRDVSETGAKIRLAPGQVIPEQCHFIQLKDGIAYDAVVEWLRLPEAGLRISNPYSLRDSSDPKYSQMRLLWQERRMRTG
jgi:PilZ domain